MNGDTAQVFQWAKTQVPLEPGVPPMFETRGDVTKTFFGGFKYRSAKEIVDTRSYSSRDVHVTVTKGKDTYNVPDGSLGMLTGQPGAGKSVTFPFRIARTLGCKVYVSMPYLALAKSNAEYMRNYSRVSGVPLYEDYDFSSAGASAEKGPAVIVTTPAVVVARYIRDYLYYDRDMVILDEVQVCDAFTYTAVQLVEQRRIARYTLLASATPDAKTASQATYFRTTNYSDVEDRPYAFQHYSTWKTSDVGKPWSVRNIARSTLIFNDDPSVRRKMRDDYVKAGIPALLVTANTDGGVMQEFYDRTELSSPSVILVDSSYSSGYTFRVLDVIDCARVCALFASLDGSAGTFERRLALWEKIQRRGRAARTELGHVGMYSYPDSEPPIDARFVISPEHVDSAYILVKLLALSPSESLLDCTEQAIKDRKPCASDLNWLFSKFQLGFSFFMMHGDSRVSDRTSATSLSSAFYCYVAVPKAPDRSVVRCSIALVSRAYSCLYTLADSPEADSYTSEYSAADLNELLSRADERRKATPVKYSQSCFYVANEYSGEVRADDVESYVYAISKNHATMQLHRRDEVMGYFATLLRFMNECAFNRAVCAELLAMAAAADYIGSARARSDVARWKADLIGWDHKWRFAHGLTHLFECHSYKVTVVPICRADILDRTLQQAPNFYLQEWREDKTTGTSKQISDSLPAPRAYIKDVDSTPAITYKDKVSPEEYAVTLTKSSKTPWWGWEPKTKTYFSPHYYARHARNDSGSSAGSSRSSQSDNQAEYRKYSYD